MRKASQLRLQVSNLNTAFVVQMAYNKKLSLKELFFLIIVSLSLFLQTSQAKPQLIFPISFAIVRISPISGNLTRYIQNIGYPSTDQNGFNIGYNLVSLDGYKAGMTFSSVNNELTPLATWVNIYSRIMGNAKNLFGKSSSQIQSYIIGEFRKRASKILFNAYSFQRPISEKNSSAIDEANNIAQFVSMYNFDGVSIDFDDFNSVKDKTASPWLTTFLKTLRKVLGKNKLIVLQVYPTFITETPVFRNPLINSWVDVFVVKYFNLLKENYSTFDTLFNKATVYTGTALWQMQRNSSLKIDICKTIIAKPSTLSGTFNNQAYLPASTLAGIIQQARIQYSWFGGYANLDFGSDSNGDYQMAALNSLRTHCNRFETCFCF